MRLCRFATEDLVLPGFYEDARVIPIQQAADSYLAETGQDLWLEASDDLLNFLPPGGPSLEAIRILHCWLRAKEQSDSEHLGLAHDAVQILAPFASPSKILLLAGNYAKHVRERGGVAAERFETFPYVFMKPPSTITHPGDPIRIPTISPDQIDWECELAVVIGRRCRNVAEDDALDSVAGYTVINDVSDRSFQPNPGRKPRDRDRFFDWLHGKWHDSFLPMGPCVVSADDVDDPQDLHLTLEVNGKIHQDASTDQMIFGVAAIVAFVSKFMTLEPGDIIATGTPAGVGSASGTFLRPGDRVRASIQGIGTLENPVAAEE